MSEEMLVDVPVKCERTGKVTKVPMTLLAAADYQAKLQRQTDAAKDVEVFLSDLHPDACPDLVVAFRGRLLVLSTVVDSPAVQRGLHLLTQHALFPDPSPKKRAKNGKRESTGDLDG